jgi:squalene-hopene/tetraprenyl-beta-curcumene cyclase
MTTSTLLDKTQTEQLAWDGLHFLLQAWQSGFEEAKHIMWFPKEQGFSSPQAEHTGDIFQRALISDVLLDATAQLQYPLQFALDREVDYLLSCCRSSGIGGWSYFPDLPELPPDADDLAQIIQVLVRTQRGADLEQYCEQPLRILLQDGVHENGAIETWIVPTSATTMEQQLQRLWIEQAWGQGADPEVMANLLYALALYDSQRFSKPISHGIDYLTTQQQSNGSWQSTWYHGDYYGTYVCLRLLALVCPDSPAVDRGIDFLLSHQLTDGSWGLTEAGDPLSTAIALLGLTASRSHQFNHTNPLILHALNFLQQQQNTDLGWSSCSFIQMQLGRATGQVRQILSYGSRSITTSYVLKALLVLLSQSTL